MIIAKFKCRICGREHTPITTGGVSYRALKQKGQITLCPNSHTSNSVILLNPDLDLFKPIKNITYGDIPEPSYDADAVAFYDACLADGVTLNGTQYAAINNLVISLKSSGIWTIMKAVYPMIGGSAASHKYNLKDPRNLDAAYRLTFVNSPTHSNNGIAFNGVSQYCNTYLKPNSVIGQNDAHLSFYSRTNSGISGGEMGYYHGPTGGGFYLNINFGGTEYRAVMDIEYAGLSGLGTSSSGFYIGSRVNSTQHLNKRHGNATTTESVTSSIDGYRATDVYIGCVHLSDTDAPDSFTDRQCAFASIGNGLSSAQMDSFYSIVQTYQTTLGRQV
jgi:hypothetical protein